MHFRFGAATYAAAAVVALSACGREAQQRALAAETKLAQMDTIAAAKDSVQDGSYPLSRSLYIYPNLGRAAGNPAITGFVDFYLSDEGMANVNDVGYVELHPDELQETRDAWEAAKP